MKKNTPIKINKLIRRRKKRSMNEISELVAGMYDKLAAKMVVALYREKEKIIKELKDKF